MATPFAKTSLKKDKKDASKAQDKEKKMKEASVKKLEVERGFTEADIVDLFGELIETLRLTGVITKVTDVQVKKALTQVSEKIFPQMVKTGEGVGKYADVTYRNEAGDEVLPLSQIEMWAKTDLGKKGFLMRILKGDLLGATRVTEKGGTFAGPAVVSNELDVSKSAQRHKRAQERYSKEAMKSGLLKAEGDKMKEVSILYTTHTPTVRYLVNTCFAGCC